MTGLRCLSLHQPWASLVAIGVKTIETRSWSTKHRGRIGIASTVKLERWQRSLAYGVFGEALNAAGVMLGGDCAALPLGAIVATANLVDCVPIVDDGAARNCVDVRVARPQADAALRLDDDAGRERIRNIRDQVPYGDFTPGRWAWLLDDVKPTTERCPECWGWGFMRNGYIDAACNVHIGPCPLCEGAQKVDPVPVKGHQGLWRWNP